MMKKWLSTSGVSKIDAAKSVDPPIITASVRPTSEHSSCSDSRIAGSRSQPDSPIQNSSSQPDSPVPGPSGRRHSSITDSDSSSDESTGTKAVLKRRKVTTTSYKQKFRDKWCEDKRYANWCKSSSDGSSAFCTVCDKKIIGGITHIKRHSITLLHKKNKESRKNTKNSRAAVDQS
ncbi:uncharacterized protein LOC115881945 [Sitophilus oryzae]|uniref:Uncharacterized protein LOC115881945 n=1 Tax=Sitophilus oryzae TaxID=7048 RepID=A0A6J2XXR3_SITOR|nr:uncharacterized protein LOC115881945 [Sitophilus oryzae]